MDVEYHPFLSEYILFHAPHHSEHTVCAQWRRLFAPLRSGKQRRGNLPTPGPLLLLFLPPALFCNTIHCLLLNHYKMPKDVGCNEPVAKKRACALCKATLTPCTMPCLHLQSDSLLALGCIFYICKGVAEVGQDMSSSLL